MKMYLKVIGCSCYTCLPRTAPTTAQSAQKDGCSGYWYWGSSDGSTSTHEHMAKNNAQHKHTSKH